MFLLWHLLRRLSKVKCVRPTSLRLQIPFVSLCCVIAATKHLDARICTYFTQEQSVLSISADFISAGVMIISQMSSLCTRLGPAYFQQGLFLLKDSMGIFRVHTLHPLNAALQSQYFPLWWAAVFGMSEKLVTQRGERDASEAPVSYYNCC